MIHQLHCLKECFYFVEKGYKQMDKQKMIFLRAGFEPAT